MENILLADIGGTHTRLARSKTSEIEDLRIYPTNDRETLLAAFQSYCAEFGKASTCSIAVAGVVHGDSVTMTNSSQTVEASAIKRATGADELLLLNDFEAAAWSLNSIDRSAVKWLNGPKELQSGNRVIVGPGTGLGIGLLAQSDDRSIVVQSEGGHVQIAPSTESEIAVFKTYRSLWPEVVFGDSLGVEAEAFLSGTGFPKLYQAVCATFGTQGQDMAIEDILSLSDGPEINETLRIYRTHLGRLAGDFAVAFTAKGGVFLNGGVALKNPWLFDETFVQAFRDGGRFTAYRSATGLYLCNPEEVGLIGAFNAIQG